MRGYMFVIMIELPLLFVAMPYQNSWYFPMVLISWQFMILGIIGFANCLPERGDTP